MSIKMPSKTHTPSIMMIEDKKEEEPRLRGVFFSLVVMETIVLPLSFLHCIPPHNAMKSKLPFLTKQIGVV